MAMSEYRKKELKKEKLKKKLDEIAEARAKKRKEENKHSYVIHTSPEALKILAERSRSHLNEEELKRKYRRIRRR